ncbi:DUF1656 domain-containing protein [Pedomonas mirosovicensis]|uniref:DUF1656 domain-containing protein n=1 Tax=Pedomonas mirosovicensis TaxID=2908641 RepID=UPI0021686ED1|nr:DUF1656 domain-containing protein [Pedomonas mirosovicensis]MCH8685777.1 DUF1656 domain-containing protein [Pedomonas mirosovicensis]
MAAEINVGGVFLPAALLWALVAFALSLGVRQVLTGLGLYRFIWHRALFDIAVFVALWGALATLSFHHSVSVAS